MGDGKRIRFAVIGHGHIGKRHAEMIRRNSECELLAVCDSDDTALAGVNERTFTDADAMLREIPEIEVVNVCTPNGLHANQGMLCLHHGKHVVVEKPLALTKIDCEKIIHESLTSNKSVFCVMQNRYSPPSVWLKQIVEENILGELYMVQLNCYWNRDARYYKAGTWKGTQELDGGTLFTQFSHWVDIMYWLFGDITNIKARFADFNHKELTDFEDSGFVNFDFVKGGMGAINYSTAVWDSNLESSLTIIGSKGSVKVGGQYMDKIEFCHIRDYQAPVLAETNAANDYGHYKGSANNHSSVIDNVVSSLRGSHKITTNALEGMKVVDIIERIYALRPEKLLKEGTRITYTENKGL
jgi:UDP-N-acetyl-2-amino-2-deoxyglucuronate dehydrogenase